MWQVRLSVLLEGFGTVPFLIAGRHLSNMWINRQITYSLLTTGTIYPNK